MTQPVDFTADAIKDLSGIASYTAEAWGHGQALRYAELVNEKFKKLQKGRYFQRPLCRKNSSFFG
jgi:plasmid stabilization system protein ParE